MGLPRDHIARMTSARPRDYIPHQLRSIGQTESGERCSQAELVMSSHVTTLSAQLRPIGANWISVAAGSYYPYVTSVIPTALCGKYT